jgi:RraA family protein
MNDYGWERHPSAPQAEPSIIEALRAIPVSLLSDSMARMTGSVGLTPYHRPRVMAGTAVTVRTRPGDNLAIHRSFDFCRPGDVLVVDGGGDLTQALMGEIMATYAESIGIVGVVLDAALRDVSAIRAHDFPMYARGVTHRGPYKAGPGDINVPVSVGGMVVSPGDVVVGDEDGLVVIAQDAVKAVIESAQVKSRMEADMIRAIKEGRLDRSWIDEQEAKMKG